MLIPKRILAVARMASADETRAAPHAVHFERAEAGKCRATATNGHALLTAEWVEDDALEYPELADGSRLTWGEVGFAATVNVDDLAKVTKALPRRSTIPVLGNAAFVEAPMPNGHGVIVAGDSTIKARTNEGEFPNWRQIMPDPAREKVVIGFDAVLLRDTLNAIIAASEPNERKMCSVRLELTTGIKDAECFPALLSHTDPTVEITAVVMPLRL